METAESLLWAKLANPVKPRYTSPWNPRYRGGRVPRKLKKCIFHGRGNVWGWGPYGLVYLVKYLKLDHPLGT